MSKRTRGVDPSAPNATAPSARWQRGCEPEEVYTAPDTPMRTQRVYDAVRALERSGRCTGAHVAAASRWTADYERGMRGPRVDLRTASIRSSSTGPEHCLAAGVDAGTRVREARRALGEPGHELMVAVCHLGCSLRSLATARGLGTGGRGLRVVGDELVAVLEALADHQAYAERHGYRGMLTVARPPKPAETTAA